MGGAYLIESTLPGVTVLINTQQVARPIERQPSSTLFEVGYSPWGPVNTARIVTSWQDYFRQFGGFDVNSPMADAIYAFFNLFPGSQAYVVRVAGTGQLVGTLTLKDRTAVTPLNTLRVDAKYPSTRVDISIAVTAGKNANTVKLTVTSVFFGITEAWDNFDLSATAIAFINQNSKLVNVTNLNSIAVSPTNLPALLAATPLAGGTDDFGTIIVATYIGTDDGNNHRTGLQVFNDTTLGDGQVAISGITTEPAHVAIDAHCNLYHRLGLLDPPLGTDANGMAALRASYGTWYSAFYWPWVQYSDFGGSGVIKFYPPSGFVAGACALVDKTIGTHKAPANIQILGALGVETASGGANQTDDNTRALLNGLDINVIAPLPEQGVKIYGARVLTGDRRVQMVHEIRLLNLFYYSGKIGYEWAVFQVVDGQGRLFRDLVASGQAFLRPFFEGGALFGTKEAEAFVVIADASNNPPEELNAQRVHVQWGVHISPTAEQIILQIDNVPLFQDLSVLAAD